MNAINTALSEANHYSTKRQILGIIANDFPINMLHGRFSGIGIHQLKAARKHAQEKGIISKTIPINQLRLIRKT